MASHNHEVLKIKALEWLYQSAKCRFVATELVFGKYIFDVVGTDGHKVYVIESKSNYQDFIRDCNRPEDIKREIKELKSTLNEDSNLKKYNEELEKLREKSTKFYDTALYKMSTHRYLISPLMMIDEDEVPDNWGLLDEEPKVIKKCELQKIDKKYVDIIIREICKKNSKKYLESIGVEFGKRVVFPDLLLYDDSEV